MEQLSNVIDLQTISELEKERNSLNMYLDNLILKRKEVEKELSNQASNDISK
jgi:seryl-tRNA synthetase